MGFQKMKSRSLRVKFGRCKGKESFNSMEEELKDWIEMKKIQTKKYNNSVWVPLYEFSRKKEGDYFHPNFTEYSRISYQIILPLTKKVVKKWSKSGTYYFMHTKIVLLYAYRPVHDHFLGR